MAKSYLDKDGLLYFLQLIRANTTPSEDGTASTGTAKRFALQDHVHPHDSTKVDKVDGKGLSANDYTTNEKNKLAGIANGAEVNVQADWNEANSSSDAFIKNKPTIPEETEEFTGATAEEDGTNGLVPAPTANTYRNSTVLAANGEWVKASLKCQTSQISSNRQILYLEFTGSTAQKSGGSFVAPEDATTARNGFMSVADKIKLDSLTITNGVISPSNLPSYVDDVIEAYPRSGATELSASWLSEEAGGSALTPEVGKIYILMSDSTGYMANTQFRWGGSAYVKMADGGISSITNAEIDTIVAS